MPPNDNANPFSQNDIVICSYQFARSKEVFVQAIRRDLVIIDEAHRSLPRNPILAKLFRIARLAENAGGRQSAYGFDKMVEGWQRYTGSPPEFASDTSFTKSVFPKVMQSKGSAKDQETVEKVGDRVGEKVGEKLTDNQQKLLHVIEEDPSVSAKKLAGKIGISSRKVEENIRKLKDKGILSCVGPARGGHWEIRRS